MKKQLKKSLSLFLAVLMLLSCWVWVAPQKAEAANSKYKVEVDYEIMACCTGNEAPDDSYLEVTYITGNGTGSETSTSLDTGDLGGKEGVSGTATLEVDGWPSRIKFAVSNNSAGKYHVKVHQYRINGRVVCDGRWVMERTAQKGGNEVTAEPNTRANEKGTGKNGTITSPGSSEEDVFWDWPRPGIKTFDSEIKPTTVLLNKVNTGIASETTLSLSNIVDTYDVNWTGTISYGYTYRLDKGQVGSNVSASGSNTNQTIAIKPWLQTLFPGEKSTKLYVDIAITGGSATTKQTETLNVAFPGYEAVFYANDAQGTAKIGINSSAVSTDGTVKLESDKMTYGSVIGNQPAYAHKPGFEFMGYYSKPNDLVLGKDVNFQGTKFEDNVTTVPHTANKENGYDSDEFAPNTSTTFIGDTKWYAAWQAAPLEVTFITADNQLIGRITGRHNNSMTATNMYVEESTINDLLESGYTGFIQFDENTHTPIYKDGSTTFDFDGWKIVKADDESLIGGDLDTVLTGNVTFQATYTKAGAETYTVTFKDLDGKTISSESGYKYRDDVRNVPANVTEKAQDSEYRYEFIGWANDIGAAYYTVDENDRDKNGALINYVHEDGAAFTVKGNATYVPVYRMIYREYNVTYNYTVNGGAPASVVLEGYHWNDNPTMPSISDTYTAGGKRLYIVGWRVNNAGASLDLDEIKVTGDMSLTAIYGNEEDATYTINFYGKDVDGETDVLLNPDKNIYKHGSDIIAPEVPAIIDTADARYEFQYWTPYLEGKASNDVDYYAEYQRTEFADVYFYNYDGSLIYKIDGKENNNLVGGKIPSYTGDTPVKAEDATGTYTFKEWHDGDGKTVTPGRGSLKGDLHLTAQFKTTYKNYTVKFESDGKEISKKTYHYGDPIVIPADPTKAEDNSYIYSFKGWTPEVSEVCSNDTTYTARFTKTPKYYNVTWLKDDKTVLRVAKYTYNAKIQQAVFNAPVSYGPATAGMTWAFEQWVQCDANGTPILDENNNKVIFIRGQQMGAEPLYFYPEFVEVANVLTVKFYKDEDDGLSLLGEAKIPYGDLLTNYADDFAVEAAKKSTDTHHYKIDSWVDLISEQPVTEVTADISVKAKYIKEEHNKQIYEMVSEPTCTVPGYANYKCDVPECTDIDYNVEIAPIPDEGKPTGQIYVGDNKWTLSDFTAGIDYTKINYVGPKTTLIVNAEDTGSRSKNNPDAELYRGVGKIEYSVSLKEVYNPGTLRTWTEIYNIESARQDVLEVVLKENKLTFVEYNSLIREGIEGKKKKAEIDKQIDAYLVNYKANATGVISNLNLEEGEKYVLYIRVTDREGFGDVNVTYFSSGTIKYSTHAPEIFVRGEGYRTTFCKEATVTVTDDIAGVKAYLNGMEVTLDENGEYKCTEKGLHTLEAVNVNGNKTIKIFEIKGGHSYVNQVISENCENAGSRYDLCTLCGYKANVETIPATGHSFTTNYIDKDPDCVTNGYRTYICDNNCGTSLVIQFNNETGELDAEKLALAGLKAEDLNHLKATGKHTYEMVKDENGEDTNEYVWIIDKEANCKDKGSKHRDCIVCGLEDARVTEEIPLDKVNGHNFYRVKVTTKATCTTAGEKTKTCKYCNEKVFVESIPALGHIAGDYRVIKTATCEATGSKILTCGRCSTDDVKVDIGEPIKDENGNITSFDGEAVEVKAIGHAYEISGNVNYDETEGKYFQDYVCTNDTSHTKREEMKDYEPPVEAIVTFMNGEETVATINKVVGTTIIETAITAPTKAADTTMTYTFSHWVDAEGKEVEFPIEVKGNATYTAVFTEKYVNYTITYYKEDGKTEFKKVGYLHNGEEVELINGPAKAEDWENTYKFAGWKTTTGDTVYTDKATISDANIKVMATYESVKKQYAVTYAYSKGDTLETFEVAAGSKAKDCEITPVKDFDSKYHYTFKAWNKAKQLESVKSNIYTTPDFEAALHDYAIVPELTKKATCGENEVVTWKCKSCDHSYEQETPGTALEHSWGTPEEKEGKITVECQRCHVVQVDTRSFTVKFYTEEDDTDALKTINYIPWGTMISAGSLPADPKKLDDSTYTYKFVGWAVKGTTDILDVTKQEVKADVAYVAVFEKILRKYTVTFAYDGKNPIKVITGVDAGSNVVYDGPVPTKKYDNNKHYVFTGWSGSTANITKDTYVTAVFTGVEHEYNRVETSATCEVGVSCTYDCKYCDYSYVQSEVTKPLGHIYQEVTGTRVEPTKDKDGSVDMTCIREVNGKVCGHTYTKTLPKTESGTPDTPTTPETPKSVRIKIKVVDQNNNPVSAATVSLYQGGEWITQDITNSYGEVSFEVAPGKYTVLFSGVKYGTDQQTEITVGNDGKISGSIPRMPIRNCGCACHHDSIWGKIFRFFHKIIKTLTGEFKCCKCPSDLY